MFSAIRQIFLKGGTISDAIAYVFKATGNMPTKSEGMKMINIYKDVQKNTGKVFDLTGKRINTSKPIIGGKNVAETEAQVKARMIKENRSNVQKSYLRQLDEKIMGEMDMTAKEMENMSSTALDDLRRNADPVGMKKQFDEITEGRGLGDFADDSDFFKDDYASGGLARVGMFGGGPIVKGGKWFLKSLRDTRKQMKTMNMSPGQLKYYLSQIDDQIKNIEAGGKIPDEVIQTIRKDPKFKSLSQNPANDPDLREIEEVLLEYGEKHASGGIAGQLHLNEGGRVPMIFGGSAGLKGLIASIKAGLNKSRKDKVKTLFPKYSADEKELLKLGEKYLPNDSATLAAKEIEAKAEGIQVLIDRLKHDKKLIAEQAKNKAMNDPNLDFLMESLETTMPEAYGPHLKKYTNIDKDILQLETIKKNLIMKDRKLNAEGGRVSLSNGGLANILGV